MNRPIIIATVSWVFALWTSYIFVGSLFYKFSGAAEPVHIFGTIGSWMSGFLGEFIGNGFANYGAYLVGIFELITAMVLLSPIIMRDKRRQMHCMGALMSVFVMFGAIFFHLFTPLGWIVTWTENGVVQMDKGLANAALSILICGLVVIALNKTPLRKY
jgi:hypothetical protein